MDLSLFQTQHTGTKTALSGSHNPLFANSGLGNLAFLEAILGNLTEIDGVIEGSNVKIDSNTLSTNDNNLNEGIKKEAVDLTLLQLALLGQDPDKSLDEKLAELKIERLSQTQENRVEQLTKLINHLTSGLPQEVELNAGTTIEDLVSRLTKRLEKLESSLGAFRTGDFNDDDAPFKLLIATGLNPAQLTKITNRIEEVEQKLGRELTVDDLIAGVGNIVPAPGDDEHEFSTTDALGLLLKNTETNIEPDQKDKTKEEETLREGTDIANSFILDNSKLPFSSKNIGDSSEISSGKVNHFDMQAILNLIASNKIQPAGTQTNVLEPVDDNTTTLIPEDGVTPLPQALSNSEFKALFGSKNGDIAVVKNNFAKLDVTHITPQASVPKFAFLGDIALPTNYNSLLSQTALSEALGFDIQTGMPFNQTMQAAHAATSVQIAGQTHPGTQMVAAQINKAAQTGDTRNIILHLNPPELGRVEVRMEFGAENTVKAHIIAEKPETYLMLQRDSAALEKALQDAGMETGSDALNYQMAEENYNFDGRRNGGNENSGTNNASQSTDDEIEIIETTMNWSVDPETGHVHYNIMA